MESYTVGSRDGSRIVCSATRGTGRYLWNVLFGSRRDVAQPMCRAQAISVLRSLGSAYEIQRIGPA